MIEAFLQESLKAVYITVLQYLTNVPQNEPDFLKQNDEDQPHQGHDVHDSQALFNQSELQGGERFN